MDKAHPGVTTFYGRDRGDEDPVSTSFPSFEDYLSKGDFQEYDYIFKEKTNTWYLINTQNGKLKKLETAIMNDERVDSVFKNMINSVKLSNKLDKELKAKNTVDRKNKI